MKKLNLTLKNIKQKFLFFIIYNNEFTIILIIILNILVFLIRFITYTWKLILCKILKLKNFFLIFVIWNFQNLDK